MINNVVLAGRAGRDPELKEFNNGTRLAEISMAVQRNKEDTDWFDIKIWGKSADVAMSYLKQGHLFAVTGRLQQEKWTDDNGNNRSKITVHANTIHLFPKGKSEQQETTSNKPTAEEDIDSIFAGNEDEIPF